MQYSSYQNKVKRMADLLAKIYAHITAIAITLAVILAVTVALVVTKGMILSTGEIAPEYVYGSAAPTPEANAFLGKVEYEYAAAGSDIWTHQPPTEVGTYQVRVVSTSTFGTPRYGQVQAYTVLPREISLAIADESVVWGNLPAIDTSVLADGDTVQYGVDYIFPKNESPVVFVDRSTVSITDAEGNDRMHNYTIVSTPDSEIEILSRRIDITVEGAEKIYDNTVLYCEGYELSESTPLADGDSLQLIARTVITNVSTVDNILTFELFSEKYGNVTEYYDFRITHGQLSVHQKPITLITGDSEKVYDAQPLICPDYRFADPADEAFLKANGHRIASFARAKQTDAGSSENIFTDFVILDKDGKDVSKNYNIICAPGTLTVTPRPITVTTPGGTSVYNGDDQSEKYSAVDDIQIDNLPNGLVVTVAKRTEMIDAGTYTNKPVLNIYTQEQWDILQRYLSSASGDVVIDTGKPSESMPSVLPVPELMAANFEIKYICGTVEITKRPVTVTTQSATVVYNGLEHSFTNFTYIDSALYLENFDAINDALNSINSSINSGVLNSHGHSVQLVDAPVFTDADTYENTLTVKIIASRISVPTEHEGYDVNNNIVNNTTGAIVEEIDLTANYEITYEYGTVVIEKRPITLRPEDLVKEYDGTPLRHDSCKVTVPVQLDKNKVGIAWLQADFKAFGEQTEAGTSNAAVDRDSVEFFLYRERNYKDIDVPDDVTEIIPLSADNFAVSYEEGDLTVTKRALTVTTDSFEAVYNGKEVIFQSATADRLVEGHRTLLTYLTDRYGPNAGEYPVLVDTEQTLVLDADGNDMTENYAINHVFGNVTIVKRPIAIDVLGGEVVYDGKPHNSEFLDYQIVTAPGEESPLLDGHRIVASPMEDEPYINADTYIHDLSIEIFDGETPVTNNYNIITYTGTVTVKPRPVIICGEDAEGVMFDGTYHTFTNFTISPISSYPLAEGHTAEAYGYEEFYKAGRHRNSHTLKVFDENGKDVSKNYSISCDSGTVIIDPRPVVVKSEDVDMVYNGEFNQFYGVELLPALYDSGNATLAPLPLLEGHSVQLADPARAPYYSSAGDFENILPGGARILNELGEDVTDCYTITYEYGTIVIRKYALTVRPADELQVDYDGKLHGATHVAFAPDDAFADFEKLGFTVKAEFGGIFAEMGTFVTTVLDNEAFDILDGNGVSVKDYFDVTFETGVLEIVPRKIIVTTSDQTWVYDGNVHSEHSFSVQNLMPGHYVELTVTGEALNAGNYENTADKDSLRVYDKDGNDITGMYDPEVLFGTLTVEKRKYYVTTPDIEFMYDGTAHQNTEGVVISNILPNHHGVADKVSTFVDAGVYERGNYYTLLIMDGETDVSSNYELDEGRCRFGSVTVIPRPVFLITEAEGWVYDGTDHTSGKAELISADGYGLIEGHSAHAPEEVSYINAGTYENRYVPVITDAEGNVIPTENYEITYICGYIIIDRRPVIAVTESGETRFTGSLHKFNNVTLEGTEEFPLIEGLIPLAINLRDDIIEIGSYENTHEVHIRTNGEDVTDNFTIGYRYGTVTVLPIRVTVRPTASEKVYNGQVQTADKMFDVSHSLQLLLDSGYKVTDTFYIGEGAGIDVGTYESTLHNFELLDPNGKLVDDIEIVCEPGTFTILPRPITVMTESSSGTLYYDGEGHSFPNASLSSYRDHTVLAGLWVTPNNASAFVDAKTHTNEFEVTIWDENGFDVTKNHAISYIYGSVRIQKRPVSYITESGTAVENGEMHSFPNATLKKWSSYAPLEGHTAVGVDVPEFALAGTYQNHFSEIRIYDENGMDVTDNYTVRTREYGTVTILPGEIVIRPVRQPEKTYDGTPLSNAEEEYLRIEEPSELWQLTQNGYTYTYTVEQVEETLAGTYDIEVTSFQILDPNGVDVTSVLNIVLETTPMVINKRPVQVQTQSNSGTIYYDGKGHTFTEASAYQWSYPSPLDGYTYTAIDPIAFVDAGSHENKFTVSITDPNGVDVTSCFDISYQYGYVHIERRPVYVKTTESVMYDGQEHHVSELFLEQYSDTYELLAGHTTQIVYAKTHINAGDYWIGNTGETVVHILDADGQDVTNNYNLHYTGSFVIERRPVCIESASISVPYDGEEHSAPALTIRAASSSPEYPPIAGDRITSNDPPSFINAGQHTNHINNYTITDARGVDVTSNYYVKEWVYGTVEILQVELTLKPQTMEKVYDGETLYPSYQVEVTPEVQLWLDRDFTFYVEWWAVNGSQTDAGEGSSSFSYVEIKDKNNNHANGNFIITYETGILRVTKRPIVVETESSTDTIYYDGTGHAYTGLTLTGTEDFALLDNLSVELTKTASYTLAGEHKNVQKNIKLVHNGWEDVTANFDVQFKWGTVTILKRPVTVVTDSQSFVFNGQGQYCDTASLQGSEEFPVPDRHTVEAREPAKFVNAGTHKNSFAVKITDENGVDVTSSYDISYLYGEVTITQLAVTLQPQFAQKIYDGTPLLPEQNKLQSTKPIDHILANGYSFTVTVTGEQTEVGDGISTITEFVLLDSNGKPATDNLLLSFEPNVLRVLPETSIEVLLFELQKVYDGTTLAYTTKNYVVLSTLPTDWTLEVNISMTEAGRLTLADLNSQIASYVTVRDENGNTIDQSQYPVMFTSLNNNADDVMLEISPRKLVLTAASQSREDDGNPLTNPKFSITMGSLIEGHSMTALVSGSLNKPGTVENIITDHFIVDALGNSMNHCYTVTYIPGTLTVTKSSNR